MKIGGLLLAPVLVLGLALAAAPAAAGDYDDYDEYDERHGYDGEAFYVDAPVVEVRPLIRVVEVSDPRRVCWNEEVERIVHDDRRGPSTGTVVGTVIGGAIGHNASKGRSRVAATAAGAVLGAVIGRDISRAHRGPPRRVIDTERRCEVERHVREEERIEGYRVFYRYAGRIFETRSRRDPGDTIRVQVRITPDT